METIDKINSFHTNGLACGQYETLFKKLACELEGGGVVIYGANHTGMKIKDALEAYSIKVLFYLDEIETFNELDGVRVTHDFNEVVQLIGAGKKIAFICSAVNPKSLSIMEERINKNVSDPWIIDKTALFYSFYHGEIFNNSGVIIRAMCSIITNLCTLRCIGCSTMTPLVIPEMKKNFEVDDLINDAERLSNIADAISCFEIMGGETLLHNDLDRYIYGVRKIKNIYLISIVTNGTLIPSVKILKAMKECDVIVRISDYGDISRKKYELVETLNEWGIVNFMRPATDIPWTDYGDFSNDGGDGALNWKNCRDRGSYCIYDGKLYPCGRIFRQVEKGLYDASMATCIGLYGNENDNIRKFRELDSRVERSSITVPLYGCKWCGDMDKKIEAGVQMI